MIRDLEEAKRTAIQNRDRFKASIIATRDRLQPKQLGKDAVNAATQELRAIGSDSIAHARRHPVAVGAAILVGCAWLLRRPILRMAPPVARSVYGWISGNLRFSQLLAVLGVADLPAGETAVPSPGDIASEGREDEEIQDHDDE